MWLSLSVVVVRLSVGVCLYLSPKPLHMELWRCGWLSQCAVGFEVSFLFNFLLLVVSPFLGESHLGLVRKGTRPLPVFFSCAARRR